MACEIGMTPQRAGEDARFSAKRVYIQTLSSKMHTITTQFTGKFDRSMCTRVYFNLPRYVEVVSIRFNILIKDYDFSSARIATRVKN